MTGNANTVPELRKLKKLTQSEVADLLGMGRTTYSYKEGTGTFTEAEKAQISKILKMDIRAIVWTKTATTAVESDKDRIIRQQAESIMKLEEKIKTLEDMIDRLLKSR